MAIRGDWLGRQLDLLRPGNRAGASDKWGPGRERRECLEAMQHALVEPAEGFGLAIPYRVSRSRALASFWLK